MHAMSIRRWSTTSKARSLAWDGDDLVDWADGRRWDVDGSESRSSHHHAYDFDRAVASPSGAFQVIYSEHATKGLILDRGEQVREIDRSYYHAAAYEYPVALGRLADGREVIAHCPQEYNRLQIDELHSGDRLTIRDGDSEDIFHSRLAFSESGRWLLSAGWVWHPLDIAEVFDVASALSDPASLDRQGVVPSSVWNWSTEIESACWLPGDRLVIVAKPEAEDADAGDDEAHGEDLRHGDLAVWSMEESNWLSRHQMNMRVGAVLPLHNSLVLSLYGHPKVIDTESGHVTQQWPEIWTGKRESSIGRTSVPAVSVHSSGLRFAVAADDAITVVDLEN